MNLLLTSRHVGYCACNKARFGWNFYVFEPVCIPVHGDAVPGDFDGLQSTIELQCILVLQLRSIQSTTHRAQMITRRRCAEEQAC
jgi:hypothetical protein